MATYVGSVFNDFYTGGAQTQYGLDGADYLSPGVNNKSYTLYGGNGNDQLLAFNFRDFLYGGGGNDLLDGYGGSDYLEGGTGNDRLYGEAGSDTLTGGGGRDSFYFSTARNASANVDTITDFAPGIDRVGLENSFFTGVGAAGMLASWRFFVGPSATFAPHRIGYDPATGSLIYDSNGNAAGGAQVFAVLDKGLAPSYADFFVT